MSGTNARDRLEPLRARFNEQHRNIRIFYHRCSNLNYPTNLINVPEWPQEPPSLMMAPNPLKRAMDIQSPSLPAHAPGYNERAQSLKQFEDGKTEHARTPQAERDDGARRLAAFQAQQRRDLEEQQRLQAERVRKAQGQKDLMGTLHLDPAASRVAELKSELLAMMLEHVDRVGPSFVMASSLAFD